MSIKKVYMKADIDRNVETVLDALDTFNAEDTIPYSIYTELWDLIASINDIDYAKTYVVEVKPQ